MVPAPGQNARRGKMYPAGVVQTDGMLVVAACPDRSGWGG